MPFVMPKRVGLDPGHTGTPWEVFKDIPSPDCTQNQGGRGQKLLGGGIKGACPGRAQNPDVEDKTSQEGSWEEPGGGRDDGKLHRFRESGQTHKPNGQDVGRKKAGRNCPHPLILGLSVMKHLSLRGSLPFHVPKALPQGKRR